MTITHPSFLGNIPCVCVCVYVCQEQFMICRSRIAAVPASHVNSLDCDHEEQSQTIVHCITPSFRATSAEKLKLRILASSMRDSY
jgi:hypothetical protein